MGTAMKFAGCSLVVIGISICCGVCAKAVPQQPASSLQPSRGAPILPPGKSETIEARSRGTEIPSPSASVRYQIEGGSFVSRTDNDGATWFGGQVAWDAQLVAGSAPSQNVCWVVGNGGDIYRTTDGAQWKKIRPPAELDFVGVDAKDAESAEVVAADGRKFRTKNGGRSWHLLK